MEDIEITAKTGAIGNRSEHFGGSTLENERVARGTCPYCGRAAAFRQVNSRTLFSDEQGFMIPVRCDACHSVFVISVEDRDGSDPTVHPRPTTPGIDDLPEEIDKYYQEALRCISANAPSGAATLFRKTIHAISIHYGLTEVDEYKRIPEMVEELQKEGLITEDLEKNLVEVKELGNDGAHINENEPTIQQVLVIKDLIDAVLNSTIVSQQLVESSQQKRQEGHDDGS